MLSAHCEHKRKSDKAPLLTEPKRLKRDRKPSARFLQRDERNWRAFSRRNPKKYPSDSRPALSLDPCADGNEASPSAAIPTRLSKGRRKGGIRVKTSPVDYIDITDSEDDDIIVDLPRTQTRYTENTDGYIVIGDSDAESASPGPSSAIHTPLTPAKTHGYDTHCSPAHAVTSRTSQRAASPSPDALDAQPSLIATPSSPSHTAEPTRPCEQREDRNADHVEPRSHSTSDVPVVFDSDRSQRGVEKKEAGYHDFSSGKRRPPPLFQKFFDRLPDKRITDWQF